MVFWFTNKFTITNEFCILYIVNVVIYMFAVMCMDNVLHMVIVFTNNARVAVSLRV